MERLPAVPSPAGEIDASDLEERAPSDEAAHRERSGNKKRADRRAAAVSVEPEIQVRREEVE